MGPSQRRRPPAGSKRRVRRRHRPGGSCVGPAPPPPSPPPSPLLGCPPPQLLDLLARAAADGLLDGGVVPVVKHMPGHGLGAVDSHHTLPQVTATAAALEQDDFAAFKGLNDLPMAMTAHVVYSACDSLPATVSGRMLGIMRHQIGFSGLIMTDDISMQALPGELDVRAQAAIAAWCDVVLHCSGVLEEMIAVSHVMGRMGMTARQRAEGALAQRNSGGSVDISNLDAQLAILVGKQAYD